MFHEMNNSKNYKILCFTDNLGSGGAQRQLSLLAILLRQRGYSVSVVTYNSGDFFEETLLSNGISLFQAFSSTRIGRIFEFIKVTKKIRPNAIIAFQETPAFIAEVASIFHKNHKLIVSERQTIPIDRLTGILRFFKLFHRFADHITSNSKTNLDQLLSLHPSYGGKSVVIYNAVDQKKFFPNKIIPSFNKTKTNFVVLASHKPQKNFSTLALALKNLQSQKDVPLFHVDWYGDEAAPGCFSKNKAIATELGLADVLSLHPAVADVPSVLNACDALIHPSLWEGLPNSVCEALSCGCPVLMSDVCDARQLVSDNINGFLFDPMSSVGIASAIMKYLELSLEQQNEMRRNAVVIARRLFDESVFLSRYEILLQ